ncbi:MAG: ATP-dependent RecD-like DNA helicase [Sporomusaceae bacterium]|nr:ATP-dependent RecD-like DNA helicase [Sporomusaceae bacterium]
MENIRGTVENIVFQSSDSLYIVFRLRPVGEKSSVAVVGNLAAPLLGEEIDVDGEWVEHPRFGRQFKAAALRRLVPTSLAGIERFLGSGAIRGIGPSLAARLVQQFGGETLDIIEHYPARLTEVSGIGAKKAEIIGASYSEQSELREIMLFLETHGVSGAYASKLYTHYGSRTIDILEQNPYRLAAEVEGIGFRKADQIAMALGLEKNHPDRLAAGLHFALLQISLAGHCCAPEEALVEETAKLLMVDRFEVSAVLSDLIKQQSLCMEDYHGMLLLYPRHLYHAEKQVAERLLYLRDRARPLLFADAGTVIEEWQRSGGISLAAAQRQAIAAALEHGVLALTGGPGTGKTTTVRGILAALEQQGCKLLLGAPTGRAAKRLQETTGREAVTVHRLLEAGGGSEGSPLFLRNEDNPLEADAIILDEVSMMDISLMHYFLRAVPEGCRVVLVGDIDQLPAVGPGSVLKDIIASGAVPVVRLTEVFRQAGESMIVVNAHRINRGRLPDVATSADFQFIVCDDAEAAAEQVVALAANELPRSGYDIWRDVQVLSPMHRLACGVENLNKKLQAALNPPNSLFATAAGINQLFRSGDKVMQTRNNYQKGVFNGDIGFITAIEDGRVSVRYPDVDVVYERGEMDELHLAYCMSVHKSQGSEYPVVILPLTAGHRIMLQRNLLYTAVTRAKERVILLGSKAALNTAVSNDRTRQRYSLLAQRLRGEDWC